MPTGAMDVDDAPLSPRATLMPDSRDVVGSRQNVFSKYIRVRVAFGWMSLYLVVHQARISVAEEDAHGYPACFVHVRVGEFGWSHPAQTGSATHSFECKRKGVLE
jgi:hypothetical protein